MGRLPALSVVVFGLACAGCDDKGTPAAPPPGAARSDAVRATAPTTPATPTVGSPTTHAAPAAPRKLCEGQLDKPARPSPKGALSHAQAPGAPALGEAIPTGAGKWTWVNLWAAWCGPCKEEMPRLRAFEQRLGGAVSVAFVSLDDDERQLRDLLASQPANGVRTSYWLPDGAGRASWLRALRLEDAALPVQIFVDPAGQVRCVMQGAVDDADYAQLAAMFARR